MLAAGLKTLTEVFNLTFVLLFAGSRGTHMHTQVHTPLKMFRFFCELLE